MSVYCSERLWLNLRNSQVSRIVMFTSLNAQIVALVCVFRPKINVLNQLASIILQGIQHGHSLVLWICGSLVVVLFLCTPLERPAIFGDRVLARLTLYR
jgi:hypothetical protein